jgi:hypothetical protein
MQWSKPPMPMDASAVMLLAGLSNHDPPPSLRDALVSPGPEGTWFN